MGAEMVEESSNTTIEEIGIVLSGHSNKGDGGQDRGRGRLYRGSGHKYKAGRARGRRMTSSATDHRPHLWSNGRIDSGVTSLRPNPVPPDVSTRSTDSSSHHSLTASLKAPRTGYGKKRMEVS